MSNRFIIENIIELARKQGLSGLELALEMGMPENAVPDWKNGKAELTTDFFE